MTQRSYPFNDYPYRSFPYIDRSGYPYGDSLEEKGGVVSRKKVGAHSQRSLAWSVVVLIGLMFWLAFKICKLLFRLFRALFRAL